MKKSKLKLAIVVVASLAMTPSLAFADPAPGWKTVGLDSKANPKYVFDVPNNFVVDPSVEQPVPISSTKSTATVALSAAQFNSPCPNFPEAIVYTQTIAPNQGFEFPMTKEYVTGISKQYYTKGNNNVQVFPGNIVNYNIAGVQAKRIDADVKFTRSIQTCNASSAHASFILVGNKTMFTELRLTNIPGSLPVNAGNGIAGSLRPA